MGVVAWITIAVVGLIVSLGAAGGIMYATDTTVGADVIDTRCAGGGGSGGGGGLGGLAVQAAGSQVKIKTKFPVPGIEHTLTEFDDNTCRTLAALRSRGEDPFVEYSIRSGHTVLYEFEGGKCLYDNEAASPVGC